MKHLWVNDVNVQPVVQPVTLLTRHSYATATARKWYTLFR